MVAEIYPVFFTVPFRVTPSGAVTLIVYVPSSPVVAERGVVSACPSISVISTVAPASGFSPAITAPVTETELYPSQATEIFDPSVRPVNGYSSGCL